MKFYMEDEESMMVIAEHEVSLDKERLILALQVVQKTCRKHQSKHCDSCPMKVGFDCPFVLAPRFWKINDGSKPWKAFDE